MTITKFELLKLFKCNITVKSGVLIIKSVAGIKVDSIRFSLLILQAAVYHIF